VALKKRQGQNNSQ